MRGQATSVLRAAASPQSAGQDDPSRHDSSLCRCGVDPEDRQGQAYNEAAFHYFLSVERERSERTGLPFLLVLVTFQEQPGVVAHIGATLARRLLSGLHQCIEETDFIGWYLYARVVGAVCLELSQESPPGSSSLIRSRMLEALTKCLPRTVARRLQLDVYRYPSRERFEKVPDTAELIVGEPDA